jgi:hypothetical protein
MLATLCEYADQDLQDEKEWPKAANVLPNRLKRLAPLFWEVCQIEIKQLSRADGQGSKPWSVRPRKATE